MFGNQKRRRRERHKKALESMEVVERAICQRVAFLIEQEHGAAQSEILFQYVVDLLLARPRNDDAKKRATVEQIAADIVSRDKELRDALFVSLRAKLAIEGDGFNFSGERRGMETIIWLKRFGEIPMHENDADSLIHLAAKLGRRPLVVPTQLGKISQVS